MLVGLYRCLRLGSRLTEVTIALAADVEYALAKLQVAWRRRYTPALTADQDVFRKLRRDGIVLLPGYADSELVRDITAEVWDNTDLLAEGRDADVVHRNARRLLLNPRKHVPRSAEIFDDAWIKDLACAYLSPKAVPDREAIQVKNAINEESIVDFYHIDEWRPLLSVFVYLTDVGVENAPMEYLVGSHRWRRWRVRREQDFFEFYHRNSKGQYENEESAYAGCLLPTQVRRLRERYKWSSLSCIGPKGTLVIFDNLGLHRARPLQMGNRLLVSSYWQLPTVMLDE